VSPSGSSKTAPAPFGWVDPMNGDFHLRADSVALNAADPADHPATDLEGKARGSSADAGAFER
jgi:hypothetical protein